MDFGALRAVTGDRVNGGLDTREISAAFLTHDDGLRDGAARIGTSKQRKQSQTRQQSKKH